VKRKPILWLLIITDAYWCWHVIVSMNPSEYKATNSKHSLNIEELLNWYCDSVSDGNVSVKPDTDMYTDI